MLGAAGPMMLMLACGRTAAVPSSPAASTDVADTVVVAEATADHSAPGLQDRGDDCADLGEIRLCFSDGCPGGVCVVPRPLPAVPSRAGYRCHGAGEARRCYDRGGKASPFRCARGRCVQDEPRLPTDGEWECIDQDGATVCRARGEAAGVVAVAADPGWICGIRRRSSETPRGPSDGQSDEQLCVDLSPDLPVPEAPGQRPHLSTAATPPIAYACHFEHGAGETRVCEVADAPPPLARSCDGDSCGAPLSCVDGHCVPRRIAVGCWLDADCGVGSLCRYATCTGPS